MANPPIAELIDRFDDADALAQLQALGEKVLPALRRAYASLESYNWITAQWLNRILAVTAPDPVGAALSLLDQEMNDRILLEPAWILRRFVQPPDRGRLLQALARATQPKPDGQDSWSGCASAISALVEGLGPVGQPEDMPLLRRLLDRSMGILRRYRRDSLSYSFFGEEYLPLAAAAAAALLSISERAALPNAKERARWRRACVEAALVRDREWNSALNAPMPFLFVRAPREAALLLEQIAGKAKNVDPLLSDLRYWLLIGRDIGLQAMVASEQGALPWLDLLARRADPNSYGPGCALEIRSFLQPAYSLGPVLDRLSGPWLSAGPIAHGAAILHRLLPFDEMAAIAVEAYFVAAGGSKEGLADDEGDKELWQQLQGAGLPAPRGWAWSAPPAQPAGVDTPQALNATLCAVARHCAQSAHAATAAGAREALAPLSPLLAHALVRHAYYRNLLLAATRPRVAARPVLWAALESLEEEKDPRMGQSVAMMAGGILRKRAGPIYLALLRAPALKDDLDVAETVVQALAGVAPPGAGEAILAFAQQIGWATERGDYGINAAITEAVGQLGALAAIPVLLTFVGHSGLGSRAEVALLRLAARDPQALGELDFRHAFTLAMEDGFSDYGPDLLSEQMQAEIMRVLEQEPLDAPLLACVCRFLYLLHGEGPFPPQVLPLLLARLPQAIADAKAHAGKEWEDRNWGGYNATSEEQVADWMSEAIKSVAAGHYSRAGWRALLGGLLRLESLDPARVELAEGNDYAYGYQEYDLGAALATGLGQKLGTREELEQAYEAMGRRADNRKQETENRKPEPRP